MGEQFKVVDLFCGAGGLHMGFEKAGYDIRLCVDNDSLVERTHKRNFPNIPFINEDIRKLSSEESKKYLDGGEVDIVIGGPPCHGFSTIGKRVSSNPEVRDRGDAKAEILLYGEYKGFHEP